jgi:steroid delta-isomerase-like uncharacterized protein
MPTEANRVLVRRGFEEGMNRRNFKVFDQIISPKYVNHNMPTPMPGPEGFKHAVGVFTSAFPDFHVTIEDIVSEEDRVVTRGYFSGTHKGAFMNVPPTGRTVKVQYIDMWRFEEGKAVENWVQMDMLGLMQQIGAIPAPPHP